MEWEAPVVVSLGGRAFFLRLGEVACFICINWNSWRDTWPCSLFVNSFSDLNDLSIILFMNQY